MSTVEGSRTGTGRVWTAFWRINIRGFLSFPPFYFSFYLISHTLFSPLSLAHKHSLLTHVPSRRNDLGKTMEYRHSWGDYAPYPESRSDGQQVIIRTALPLRYARHGGLSRHARLTSPFSILVLAHSVGKNQAGMPLSLMMSSTSMAASRSIRSL